MLIKIYMDGDAWCALVGKDIQDGIVGWGRSPFLALQDLVNQIAATFERGSGIDTPTDHLLTTHLN